MNYLFQKICAHCLTGGLKQASDFYSPLRIGSKRVIYDLLVSDMHYEIGFITTKTSKTIWPLINIGVLPFHIRRLNFFLSKYLIIEHN